LPGVSEKIIANLQKAGIDTVQKLSAADDEALLAVDGVGEKTAAKLRESAKGFLEELEKLEAELESEAFDETEAKTGQE
jgi:ERCC4-type nuclease